MIVFPNPPLQENLSSYRSRVDLLLSLVETAGAHQANGEIKFCRGSTVATFNTGGSISLSHVVGRDSHQTNFIGIYTRREDDLRKPAIDAAEALMSHFDSMKIQTLPIEHYTDRQAAVLEAACVIANIHSGEIDISMPWHNRDAKLLIHHDGNELRLKPEITQRLTADLPEAMNASLVQNAGNSTTIHFERGYRAYTYAPDAIASLRSVAACGLPDEELQLKTRWR